MDSEPWEANSSSQTPNAVAFTKLGAGCEIACETSIKAVSRDGDRSSMRAVDSDLLQAVRPFVGPAHLLLLRHAMADNLVHRRLRNAAADQWAR